MFGKTRASAERETRAALRRGNEWRERMNARMQDSRSSNAVPVDSDMSSVALRFEGGLGDHLLGMRLLPFVRSHFPQHEIVAYSDCSGHQTQLDILAMSPDISRIVAIYPREAPTSFADAGRLERLRPDDVAAMMGAEAFVDAHGEKLYIAAARQMGVPLFDILASRPRLQIPNAAHEDAARFLQQRLPVSHDAPLLVGLNLTKSQPFLLHDYEKRLNELLTSVLRNPRIVLLNFFASKYEYRHWPEPMRTERHRLLQAECHAMAELGARHERIVTCENLPISTTAALLERCGYFIGVDNGIKHLAWALGIPLTYYHHEKPAVGYILRWMPDVHRLTMLCCDDQAFSAHLSRLCDNLNQVRPVSARPEAEGR